MRIALLHLWRPFYFTIVRSRQRQARSRSPRGERERGSVVHICTGDATWTDVYVRVRVRTYVRLRLLPPEMNWAYHSQRSQSSASNLLRWSCAHWRVASVLCDVPLSAATSRAGNWALIRVLRSARLRWL